MQNSSIKYPTTTFPQGFENPDALALFSGGLDSILAARMIQEQGLKVLCLHFISPFFGKPELLEHWQDIYGLKIIPVDIGENFVQMLKDGPAHGVGKVINPCVDCKILMLSVARELMLTSGALCIITGEVLGQRPMSQRRDTLNIIRRDAMLRDYLLRPLCAKLMEPTKVELDGLVDRERLLSFSGRGRKDQLALAKDMGLTEIPTPGGGCLLTEKENARSYWPVLAHHNNPGDSDFRLAATGRQYWLHLEEQEAGPFWLCIGRNQQDNDALQSLATETDIMFKAKGFPGPVAIGRQVPGKSSDIKVWPEAVINSAASFVASFSPRASRHHQETGHAIEMRVHTGKNPAGMRGLDAPMNIVSVTPARNSTMQWVESQWEEAKDQIRAEMR